MFGVHVEESVGSDGLKVALVTGPAYVFCKVMPAANRPRWYVRETQRQIGGPVERTWYPTYDEAVAAAVNYAGPTHHAA